MITRKMLVVLIVVLICIWLLVWCSLAVADSETVFTIQGVRSPWGIGGSNAPLANQISSTLPIFGGNGGYGEIFTGVVSDTGDGSDGDLTQSTELEPGEYFYRYVAFTGMPSSFESFENFIITITVRGHVIIHCQYMFEAIVCADYSYGPPILEVYAGYPSAPEDKYFGEDFGHWVHLKMCAPDSEEPIDGGSFIFHTNAIGGIYSLFGVQGGDSYNGGNGGNGGSISLYTNDGRIYAQNYVYGGAGGDAIEIGRDGGCGGDGGSINIKTVCINTEPNDCDIWASFSADGGNGGIGASAEPAMEGMHGNPGGHGGHGGNAGQIIIEADTISSVSGSLGGGSGGRAGKGSDGGLGALEYGAGGRGGDGGAGGQGGEIWIEGVSVTLEGVGISGGLGGRGAFGGEAGTILSSQTYNNENVAGDGGAGGSGGDGGPAGYMMCVAEDLVLRRGSGSNEGKWLANGGHGGSALGGGRGGGDSIIVSGNPTIISGFSQGGDGGPGGNGGDGGPGGRLDISYTNMILANLHHGGFLFSCNGGAGGDGGRGGYGGWGAPGGDGNDGGDGGTAGSAGYMSFPNISFNDLSTECENGRHGNGGTGGFGGRAPEEGRELHSPGDDGGNGGTGGDGYIGGDGGGGGSGNYGGNGGNGGDSWSDDGSSDTELDSQEDVPKPGQGGDRGIGSPSPENDGEPGNLGKFIGSPGHNDGGLYDRPDRIPDREGNRWTIMYYSAADDPDIEDGEINRLDQLEKWDFRGSPVTIVVQMDRYAGADDTPIPFNGGDWSDTRQGIVEYDGRSWLTERWQGRINTNLAHDRRHPRFEGKNRQIELDTSEEFNLLEFVNYAKKVAPAEHYMLVISGHGNPFKGVAHDASVDYGMNALSPRRVRNVLEQLKRQEGSYGPVDIDIVFFNACLTASLEWIAELYESGNAKYFVASEGYGDEGVLPNPDFALRLRGVIELGSTFEPEEVAKALVKTWPLPKIHKTCFTAFDVSKYLLLRESLDDFTHAVIKLDREKRLILQKCAIEIPTVNYLYHSFSQQKDIDMFMYKVINSGLNTNIIDKARAVRANIKGMILDAHTNATEQYWGVSVQLLDSHGDINRNYNTLALAFREHTNWFDFLISISNLSDQYGNNQTLVGDLPDMIEHAMPVSIVQSSQTILTSFIDHPYDVDALQFHAPADKAVNVRLNIDLVDGAILQIYGPQGQTLLGQALASSGQEAVVQVDALSHETTYICVVSTEILSTENDQTDEWPVSYSLEVILTEAADLVSTLEIASGNIDFGAIQINSTPGFQSIEITNSGLLPVKIEDITIEDGNDFAPLLYFPLPISIEPNSTGGFAVEFYPTRVGQYTGIMTLVTEDPEQPFVELTLTGLGVDEPDDIAPESSAQAWTAHPSYPSIVVSWSGWDGIGGSGIAWYDVYVSFDGGEYKLWQFRTTENSAVYPGQSGHSYAFYSIATDKAGNVEFAPNEPDTKIDIIEP